MTINETQLAKFLKEGATKLSGGVSNRVRFASYTDDRYPPKYDDEYWKPAGTWERSSKVHVLVPKNPNNPGKAVWEIFEQPDKWRFDCSQFAQVISFYAWLRMLRPGFTKFNARVKKSNKGIKIKPFQGSVFTSRKHYYWRDSPSDPMRIWDYTDKKPWGDQVSVLSAEEIAAAAPVGSRVGFRNEKGSDNFLAEQTIKVGADKYMAHGLSSVPISQDQVILKLYSVSVSHTPTLAEAELYTWIRDVAMFI